MITNNQIQELAENFGVADSVIEKDYFIELFIIQSSMAGLFKEKVVFRGGTALRKGYFEDYRFSEDMDFVVREKNRLVECLEILKKAVDGINDEYPWNSKIRSETRNDRLQAFVSYDVIPEIKSKKELKIDITEETDERACHLIKMKFIHNDFKDTDIRINTYELETVAGNKMSRIISIVKEARDIYDLWKLMGPDLNGEAVRREFKNRMGFEPEAQTVIQHMKDDVFKTTWKSRLEAQVPGLPEYEKVIAELEPLIMSKLAS